MRATDIGISGADGSRVLEFGLIGAVAGWCEALHGKAPLPRSLQLLASGIDAEAAAISRYGRFGGTEGRPLIWDRAPADVRGGRLSRSGARALLGNYFDAARPGSLWFRSMFDDVAAEIREFQAARGLRELVVIPLETDDGAVDFIEFHFGEKLRSYQQTVLNSLAPVLAQTWKNRERGLFTEAALRQPGAEKPVNLSAPILSSDNPARLSRAEYRVGLMLSRGMSPDQVKSALNIQDSTLRTHLSNLYAKTRSANLTELVFLLVSAAPAVDMAARSARPA